MTRHTRIGVISGLIAVLLVVLILVVLIVRDNRPAAQPTASATGAALSTPTHVLGTPGSTSVTVVEFLDFECEACGAFYPYVEQLRKDYAGKVTFGFRYFPLPGHGNSRNAAAAVEAAARQGKVEEMYQKMYQTQKEWGELGTASQAPRFRGYAEQLDLDMARYDRDVASKSVARRVQQDVTLGSNAGVNSTPTFLINGDRVQLNSYDDLQRAVETAVKANR